MRLLLIGNFGTGWDGSQCDEKHIADALEELGVEVVRMQREQVTYEVQDAVDVVLIAQWDGYEADMIPKLKELLNCLVVYWAFDYQEDGQEWHERLVNQVDLYLSKPFKDSKYSNWHWLSQDFAPKFLNVYVPKIHGTRVNKDIDVLFTGSWVPWESGKKRVEILKNIDENFNLQINSVTPDQWKAEGFKNVQGPVMDKELPALIARAKVNFSMDHTIAKGYWSDRNAQIMACGGLVFFHYVPQSETIFRNNIIYFYPNEDYVTKLKNVLALSNEIRGGIAERGYFYAHRNLMVTHRVQDFLTLVRNYI